MSAVISDTASVIGEEIDVVQMPPTRAQSRLSWSAAIAGVFVAIAVTFIVVSLGSGIGLAVASPYSGPSGTTLTLIGAVWLVMAQAFGFACGGYLSARLRAHFEDDVGDEGTFRDAAQGFLVWALGVAAIAIFIAIMGLSAARTATSVSLTSGALPSNAQSPDRGGAVANTSAYFVDMLFRPATTGPAATGGAPAAVDAETRAEAARILARGVAGSGMSAEDRSYLAYLVSKHTGLSQDDAQRRVASVENQAREALKTAADKAATAGAFLSFWTFMSLLFGAVAATLAGLLGGEAWHAEPAWSRRPSAVSIQPE